MSRRTIRKLLLGVLMACVSYGTLEAQKQMTIGNVAGKQGDTLLVPISVGSIVSTDSVYSFQATFSFNTAVLRLIGVQTSGTILDGFGTVLFNPTTNTVAVSGINPLAGSGSFLTLKGVLVGNPGTQTVLSTVLPTQFNEGQPALTVVNGSARVLAIHISPHTLPGTVYVGDIIQFAATGDQLLPLVWSTSDTTVGTIDTTGKFRAIAAGQVKVFLRDAQGLKDSTDLFGIYSVLAKSLNLSVHDTAYTQTLLFNLPIYISDVTGLGILSSQFTLTFNSSALQAVSIILSNSMTSSWGTPTFNVTTGRVDVALAGTSPLAGAGVLAYVRFRVLGSASGTTAMSFLSALFNENLNANMLSGQFTAIQAPIIAISPNTAICTVGDTIHFHVTSGGTPPYVWSLGNSAIGTIDIGGLLQTTHRGTTSVNVTDAFGFSGSTGTIVVNDCLIGLPDTLMGITDSIEVPVEANNLTGLGVFSYQFNVVYDSNVVRVAAVLSAGTLSAGYTVSCRDSLDTLRIAAAGSTVLGGGGALIKIRLKSASSTVGASSPLSFGSFKLNEGAPTSTLRNGSVSLQSNSVLPVELISFTATPVHSAAELRWKMATEINSYGFDVERRTIQAYQPAWADQTAPDISQGTPWSKIGNVPSLGSSATPHEYSFVDRSPVSGRYSYRLKQILTDGNFRYSQDVEVEVGLAPKEIKLNQNYPNPFNPATTIEFTLPDDGRATLKVFDMLGREVATLVDNELKAGYVQKITFDASHLTSGTYWIRLQFKDKHKVMKMILMK